MKKYVPLLLVTALAYGIGQAIPLLGSQFLAILLGMIVASTGLNQHVDTKAMKKVGGDFLKYGIVLLGFTLSFTALTGVGLHSLKVTLCSIATAFISALFFGRLLKVRRKTQLLIGMGTAICGGSAIAAAAPIVEAEEDDITLSIATIFLYNTAALFIFPLLGHALGYNDLQFGLFAGAAINDTSSVVAAGFAYSQAAGSLATVVKLVRTLMIVPVCIGLIYTRYLAEKKNSQSSATGLTWQEFKRIVPQFVIWFIAAVILASVVPLPASFTHLCKQASKLIMTFALAAVGLTVNFQQLRKAGARPLILGGLCWLSVMATAILAIQFLY